MAKLTDIESIGNTYSKKLKAAGISSLNMLLKTGSNKKGRMEIAQKSGINEKQILEWVNRADLSRIKGVSTQYSDLLEHTGVDSIPELAQRNPDKLYLMMTKVNKEKQIVRNLPSVSQVKNWIQQARTLPRMVTH
jgi:predicted flap endonuclease-1-like 5' DNA nuclease